MGRPRKNPEPKPVEPEQNIASAEIDYDSELVELARMMDKADKDDSKPSEPSPQLPTPQKAPTAPTKPEQAKKGENMLRIMMAVEQSEMSDIDTDSYQEVWSRVKEYLKICCKYDTRPSFPGLALSLGVTRETLMGWLDGTIRKPREVRRVLEKAVMILNVVLEDNLQNNKINTVSGIYLSKANFGYTDTTKPKEQKPQPLGERVSDEELYSRFEGLAEIEESR